MVRIFFIGNPQGGYRIVFGIPVRFVANMKTKYRRMASQVLQGGPETRPIAFGVGRCSLPSGAAVAKDDTDIPPVGFIQ